MARTNVYLPDALVTAWRTAGRMNLSRITQIAIEQELARSDTDLWLWRVAVLRGWDVSHEDAVTALLDGAATAGADA
jgi:post-segregation antitoxin (ccd killing protein)